MSHFSKGLIRLASSVHRFSYKAFDNQIRNYAARKGTRDRKQKKKVKVEEEKVGYVPKHLKNKEKMLLERGSRKFDDSWKQVPLDNVYIARYYKWRVYSFLEAVECHRETHHPEVYNQPNASLLVTIELNMEGEKKTRFVDNFTKLVSIPHKFDHGEERSVVAFTKDADLQLAAKNTGATLAGGVELIKEIQNGNILMQDIQYCIAHPNILPELVPLRGLLKKKFPNPKNGTLDQDVVGAVERFLNGITCSAAKDEYEKDFGLIEVIIGTIDMDPKKLEENFAALLQSVLEARPKRDGPFISRCLLSSPPSRERLKVDHTLYVKDELKLKQNVQEQEAVAV